ncbi:ClpP/crotonase-like domain-containing protein [Lasiosphaeria miniovina]|uniref:ClpP/crotonase-like domain-containing protein n=1 Tax=Lasiosphaeria miniovina TaxID=1954250 RepID=A0AA40EAK9_9PEZI|nr:ClpP/crotonase-like domain-containing protein [Lasiosphaeria miniovina]KAK0728433.1 ClpP/crotonase-like domain-containing protein [Lasiosphaeria miniovina]
MAQQLEGYAAYKHYLVTSAGPFVAHVEINRPAKLNAFLEAMWLELRLLFQQLSADPEVRAVVLSGAGDRAFTAGLDVQAASQGSTLKTDDSLDGARTAAHLRRHIVDFQDCLTAVEKCAKPVICVLHGISIGLAIDLSCCADVRICARDTRFAVKEVDIGLAADIGTLARLPKAVSSFSWVKDVCLSARDFGAAEALAVGFVSQVHESKTAALDAATKLARLLASKSPVAVQGTKELLNHGRDHSVEDNLRYTSIWNSVALQSSDLKVALLSGIQKTKPRFEKL